MEQTGRFQAIFVAFVVHQAHVLAVSYINSCRTFDVVKKVSLTRPTCLIPLCRESFQMSIQLPIQIESCLIKKRPLLVRKRHMTPIAFRRRLKHLVRVLAKRKALKANLPNILGTM